MGNRCPNGHTMSNKKLGNAAFEYSFECETCGHVEFKYARGGHVRILATAAAETTRFLSGLVVSTRKEFGKQVEAKAKEMVRGMFQPRKRAAKRGRKR